VWGRDAATGHVLLTPRDARVSCSQWPALARAALAATARGIFCSGETGSGELFRGLGMASPGTATQPACTQWLDSPWQLRATGQLYRSRVCAGHRVARGRKSDLQVAGLGLALALALAPGRVAGPKPPIYCTFPRGTLNVRQPWQCQLGSGGGRHPTRQSRQDRAPGPAPGRSLSLQGAADAPGTLRDDHLNLALPMLFARSDALRGRWGGRRRTTASAHLQLQAFLSFLGASEEMMMTMMVMTGFYR